MRQLWKDIAIAIFMGMILPGILTNAAVMFLPARVDRQPPVPTEPVTVSWPVMVRTTAGDTVEMDMERYLTGVVLAEMPASFEPEALKAQSVAARTYAQKAAMTGGKHGDGSVCVDSTCCQGYLTTPEYLEKGGTEEAVEKIRQAVEATGGYVLMYEGELIEALYFSSSGGTTEDAAAVWGVEYPYLQSVSSPGEETVGAFSRTVTFTAEEFQNALNMELKGSPENWFTITTYTEGGGVASMTIGGQVFSGTELRSALGLRSTAFTVGTDVDGISITTRGYGHRVGMSQYGADAMAVEGSTFEEILAHYYPGTDLIQLSIDENGNVEYP